MYPSDPEILDAFRRDGNRGGELLFKRYYRPLVLFANSYLSGLESAEDLVQDFFYHFIKDKIFLQVDAHALSTYLFRCVKNACLNKLRDAKEVCVGLELLEYDAIEVESKTISPELIAEIMTAIRKLPSQTRLIVEGIVVDGKKYKDVAQELNISVNTVKSLLSSGLKQLRGQFSNQLFLFFFGKFVF